MKSYTYTQPSLDPGKEDLSLLLMDWTLKHDEHIFWTFKLFRKDDNIMWNVISFVGLKECIQLRILGDLY